MCSKRYTQLKMDSQLERNYRAEEDSESTMIEIARRLAKNEPLALSNLSRFREMPRAGALKRAIKRNKSNANYGDQIKEMSRWENDAKKTEAALFELLPVEQNEDEHVKALETFFNSQTVSTMRTMLGSFLKLCCRWDWKMQVDAPWSEKDGNMYKAITCKSVIEKLPKYVPREHAEWVSGILEAHASAVIARDNMQNRCANNYNLEYVGASRAEQEYKQMGKEACCAMRVMEEALDKMLKAEGIAWPQQMLTYDGALAKRGLLDVWRNKVWATMQWNPPAPLFSGDTGEDCEGPTVMIWNNVSFQVGEEGFDKVDFLILSSTGELILVVCQTDVGGLLDKDEQKELRDLEGALCGKYTGRWHGNKVTGTATNRFGKVETIPEVLVSNGWREEVRLVWVTPRRVSTREDVVDEIEDYLDDACPSIPEDLYRECASQMMEGLLSYPEVGFDVEKGLTGIVHNRDKITSLLSPETREKLFDVMLKNQCKRQEWQVWVTFWMVSGGDGEYPMMVWKREPKPLWSAEHEYETGDGWISRNIFVNRRMAGVSG